mmetsp:Transcript_28895/g.69327  ORF Transcript_28895/g.69327 Transcript_28895/m.69327 type:complete len:428 (-) Transcript_28895:1414-2697(-)
MMRLPRSRPSLPSATSPPHPTTLQRSSGRGACRPLWIACEATTTRSTNTRLWCCATLLSMPRWNSPPQRRGASHRSFPCCAQQMRGCRSSRLLPSAPSPSTPPMRSQSSATRECPPSWSFCSPRKRPSSCRQSRPSVPSLPSRTTSSRWSPRASSPFSLASSAPPTYRSRSTPRGASATSQARRVSNTRFSKQTGWRRLSRSRARSLCRRRIPHSRPSSPYPSTRRPLPSSSSLGAFPPLCNCSCHPSTRFRPSPLASRATSPSRQTLRRSWSRRGASLPSSPSSRRTTAPRRSTRWRPSRTSPLRQRTRSGWCRTAPSSPSSLSFPTPRRHCRSRPPLPSATSQRTQRTRTGSCRMGACRTSWRCFARPTRRCRSTAPSSSATSQSTTRTRSGSSRTALFLLSWTCCAARMPSCRSWRQGQSGTYR